MNNLPSNIEPITMFKESDYPFKLDMYPEYTADPEVTFEIWYGSKKVDTFSGAYDTGTKRITGTFDSDKIKVMPPVTDYYILLDGEYKFGGKIKPQLGSGEPNEDALQVQLSEGNLVVVEVMGLDVIRESTELAQTAATEATEARDEVLPARDETIEARDITVEAKDDTISARDTAVSASTTATTQAEIAVTKASEAYTSAANALTSEQNSAASETNAASSESNASNSEANALSYKNAAEGARDSALIQVGSYATIAAGIAATTDGQLFRVQGGGDIAVYEYKRTSSTTADFITSYPSASSISTFKGQITDVAYNGTPFTVGAPDTLSTYTTSTNFNLRIAAFSTSIPGIVNRIDLWSVKAGTLNLRVFRDNKNGTFKLIQKSNITIALGLNSITTGFVPFFADPDIRVGFFFNATSGLIGYKTKASGVSFGAVVNADPNVNDDVVINIASTAEFGIVLYVSPESGRSIKKTALPELKTSDLTDDEDFGGWKTQAVKSNDLLRAQSSDVPSATVATYGPQSNLSTYTSSATFSTRIVKDPVVYAGALKTIGLWCITAGVLKVRAFRDLGGGALKCFAKFDCNVVLGANTLTAGVDFTELDLIAGDRLAVYLNAGFANVGYKTIVMGSGIARPGNDVPLNDIITDQISSAAEFAVNFTIQEYEHAPVIKQEFITPTSDSIANIAFIRGRGTKFYAPRKYGVLIAGQSNTDAAIPYAQIPQWFIDAGRTIPGINFTKNPGTTFGSYTVAVNADWAYDLFLYKSMIDYLRVSDPTNQMYVIKQSIPGTSISVDAKPTSPGYWDVFFEKIPSNKPAITKEWEKRLITILASGAAANFDIRCVVWHQGESDQGDPDNYYQNLRNLIWYVRGVLNMPKLMWILGGINTSSTSFNQKVQNAKIKLASEDPYIQYVEVLNGTQYLNPDSLHWNATGAQDFADKVFALIKNIEPSTTLNGGMY